MNYAAAGFIAGALLLLLPSAHAAATDGNVVRIAEIEVDPAVLDRYKAALSEEISASIRLEPGVLTLYAVAVKGRSNQIRLFEIYASDAAYQSHLQSEHFRKYKAETASMIKSLKLIETDPIMLGSK